MHICWGRVDGGIGFRVWTTMTFELAMASGLQPSIIGGLHVQVDDLEHMDLPTFSAQQVDIIMAL